MQNSDSGVQEVMTCDFIRFEVWPSSLPPPSPPPPTGGGDDDEVASPAFLKKYRGRSRSLLVLIEQGDPLLSGVSTPRDNLRLCTSA